MHGKGQSITYEAQGLLGIKRFGSDPHVPSKPWRGDTVDLAMDEVKHIGDLLT